MIEQFLQKKIAQLLGEFVQFEKSSLLSMQGQRLTKSRIKPKLVEIISQVLGMPLELTQGMIDQIKINMPWQKLFLMNSSIKLQIQGFKIKTKLKNQFNQNFTYKARQSLIKHLTGKLISSDQSTSPMVKKLKEYFMDTLELSIKDIQLQIEVQLEHKINLLFSFESIIAKQEHKLNTLRISVKNFSVKYKVGHAKPQPLLYPTNMVLTRQKQNKGNQLVSEKSVKVQVIIALPQKIHLNINNHNFNDIRRFLSLVSWHNSFMHLPVYLWKEKPLPLNKTKPLRKVQYYATLINENMKDRDLRKNLMTQRKMYKHLYTDILKGNKDPFKMKALNQLEDKMYVWKIVAYRNFCIQNLKAQTKKKAEQAQKKTKSQQIPEKDTVTDEKNQTLKAENKLNGISWMKSWFRTESNEKQLINELEEKLDRIQTIPSVSAMNLTIKQILVNVEIITYTARQNFLTAKAFDINYTSQKDDENEIQKHQMICGKFRVEYDEYLGHDQKYACLLETKREGEIKKNFQMEESEQEFEQIQNFFQFRNFPDYHISIQPLRICINHQIIERLTVFDFEKVEGFSQGSEMKIVKHLDPYLVLKEINKSFSPRLNPKQLAQKMKAIAKDEAHDKTDQKVKYIQTGLEILIPQEMAKQLCPCNQIVFDVHKIAIKLIGNQNKNLSLQEICFKCNFPNESHHAYQAILLGQRHIETYTFLYPFSVEISQKTGEKQQQKIYQIDLKDNLDFDLVSDENFGKLIKILYLLKPVSKDNRNRYRMNMRRKQSIGEEWMDACQNLNEHIFKSTISGTEIKRKKYSPLTQKNNRFYIRTKEFYFKFQNALIQISPISIDVQDENIEGLFVYSSNQKQIKFEIYEIKKFSEYLGRLSETVKKIAPPSEKALVSFTSDDQTIDSEKRVQFMVQEINFQINAFYENVCFLKIQLNQISLNKQANRKYFEFYFLTKYKNGSSADSQFLPLIQKTKVLFEQKVSYNNLVRSLSITGITIDFTPQIFKFITKLYRIYLQSLQNKVKIQNNNLNSLKINISGNRYVEVKPFQTETIQTDKDCNMILFGNKIELNLRSQFENHALTQNCSLIKAERRLKIHTLQSNIKIVNHQDRTLWISIKGQKPEQNKFPPRTNQIIDIKYLSTANSFEIDSGNVTERGRGTSTHRKPHEKEENSEKVNMPLKPKQVYNVLINNEDEYFQIIDQGVTFQQIKVSDIFKNRQMIIGDEDEEYMILRCTQTKRDKMTEFLIQILAPIYIVNKLPWKISHRIGKETLDIDEIAQTKGRIIRKRSFEAVPLQKIHPLEHNKIRTILYRQIHDFSIALDEFSGVFPIENLINEMLKIKGEAQKYQQSTLICLSNGKKNIQLILKLQISDEVLKIKVYPEFVFVNLCQMDVFFKIKESEYTYPEVKLKTIKDAKKGHILTKSQQQIQSFVKTYISLSNEKYNQKDILQQLFIDFAQKIQIFAGTINKNLKRFFIYESGTTISSSSGGSGYNSAAGGGYTSGSDAKEQIPHFNTSEFGHDSLIEYGANKSLIFYRNLKIDEYFNLVIFIPTIKIINKSTSVFMVKSKANKRLIRVEGQQMNYLTVNCEGFSVQALDENEQVNFNEWFNINISILGTIYYAKQLSSNGYESKEYTLRKKKLRKRPKIFYRIVSSQHERGIQILIEESQYPPLSFINKTPLKLKIQQQNEAYEEELAPNQMAEFASIKNPYIEPMFKLYYAQHYEYQFVEKFNVDEFKTIPCSKSSKFTISVEQFKDKKIVVFADQKLMHQSQIKNQFQIEKVEKFNITINTIIISFMNEFYKQFSALKVSDLEFQKQNKNDKQYFKFKINDIEGYDYSGIQPNLTFQKMTEQKNDMFKTLSKVSLSNSASKNIFNSNIVISYHKNATIVEKCHMRLASLKIVFNSYLILESIKVYHNQIFSFFKLLTMYNDPAIKKASQNKLMRKEFIFESFVWEGTSVTLKCLNLNIFSIFVDKSYYKWIIKFLEWVGDLKPISFSSHEISYENYTIEKLVKRINVKKKFGEFAKILLEYPLRQVIDITSIFIGTNEKSPMQKLRIMVKIMKGFGRLIYNSGLVPGISKRSNKKDEGQDHLSYRQAFEQTHSIRTTQTVLDKIKFFEYAEWKYEQNFSANKLTLTPINRLERYNLKSLIIDYEINKARIKVALDSFHGNKVHREIEFVETLNETMIMGLTEEYTVLYFVKKDEWKVKKHQQIVNMNITVQKPTKANTNPTIYLRIIATLNENETVGSSYINTTVKKEQSMLKTEKSKLDIFTVTNPMILQERLIQIKKYIESNKLLNEY